MSSYNHRFYAKILPAAVLIIFFAFSLLAPPVSAEADDRVVIGQTAEAPGLHILMEVDTVAFERLNLINEPLIILNRDLDLEPNLATDWEISDDATRVDVQLREGVKWHHGREMTAEDVKYTFEWILDDDNPVPYRDLFEPIDEVEVVDDYKAIFHLEEPYTFMVNNLARMGLVPHDYHEEVGYEEFRQNPVGTGPYEHKEWEDSEYHILSSFADYWDGEPNFSELEFRPIPEDSSRLLAFEAGEIDMYQGGVLAEEIERLEEDPEFDVYRTPGTGYVHMAMNSNSDRNPELLSDRYFRRAVAHAVNREGIVEHVMNGIGSPGQSNIPPNMPHFNDEIDYPEYDLEKAREYLEKSPAEQGDSIEIYLDQDSVNMQIAEIMEYELGQIGIDLEINVEEWGALLDRILDSNDYDMYFGSWTGQTDPDRASFRQFHSEGDSNHTHYSNERVDELLEEGRTVDPTSERSREIYKEVQEILIEDVPTVFLYYYEEVALVQPEFEGFEIFPYASRAWGQLVDQVERVE